MKNSYKYVVRATNRFKKAAKRMTKRGKDTQKLKDVVEILAKGLSLADSYKDPSPYRELERTQRASYRT